NLTDGGSLSIRSKRVRRIGIFATVLAVGVVSAVVSLPGTASAYVPDQPPCYGATCVGQNPPTLQNPGDAPCPARAGTYTVASYIPSGGGSGQAVELRYSPWGAANWARSATTNYGDYFVRTWDWTRADRATNAYWTTMVDGTQLAQICIRPPYFTDYT